MAYSRTTWQNDVTPLNATNMNNIEDGIEEAIGEIVTITSASGTLSSADLAKINASDSTRIKYNDILYRLVAKPTGLRLYSTPVTGTGEQGQQQVSVNTSTGAYTHNKYATAIVVDVTVGGAVDAGTLSLMEDNPQNFILRYTDSDSRELSAVFAYEKGYYLNYSASYNDGTTPHIVNLRVEKSLGVVTKQEASFGGGGEPYKTPGFNFSFGNAMGGTFSGAVLGTDPNGNYGWHAFSVSKYLPDGENYGYHTFTNASLLYLDEASFDSFDGGEVKTFMGEIVNSKQSFTDHKKQLLRIYKDTYITWSD